MVNWLKWDNNLRYIGLHVNTKRKHHKMKKLTLWITVSTQEIKHKTYSFQKRLLQHIITSLQKILYLQEEEVAEIMMDLKKRCPTYYGATKGDDISMMTSPLSLTLKE